MVSNAQILCPIDDDRTKFCPNCKTIKLPTQFSLCRSRYDGLQSHCKDCSASRSAAYYQSNKQRTQSTHTQRLHRLSDKIVSYLQSHPCVDCGEADPVVLDFDHIRGKKIAAVASMAHSGRPWQVIADEIAKCEVRCSNCHRRVTARRNGKWRRAASLAVGSSLSGEMVTTAVSGTVAFAGV